MAMQFEAVKNFVEKHIQAAVVGAAATLGLTGCGSAVPKQADQNFGRQNLGALTAPQKPGASMVPAAAARVPAVQASDDIKNLKTDQLEASNDMKKLKTEELQASKDIRNLKTDQLVAKIDQEMRTGNPVYADAVLNQLRGEDKCARYAVVLRHVMTNYPQMREICLDLLERETTARMGNQAEDLLVYYARVRPEPGKVLAGRIAKGNKVAGYEIQKGFPEVAARMRDAADQSLSAQYRGQQ